MSSESSPIQDVSDAEKVSGRPEVDINLFGCPGIGVPEAGTYELNGNAFSVHDCAEIMAECMWAEFGYPGVPGKFITEAV